MLLCERQFKDRFTTKKELLWLLRALRLQKNRAKINVKGTNFKKKSVFFSNSPDVGPIHTACQDQNPNWDLQF